MIIHHFKLHCYHSVKGEVEVYKESIVTSGKRGLDKARKIFKDLNIDCFNVGDERIKVLEYRFSIIK